MNNPTTWFSFLLFFQISFSAFSQINFQQWIADGQGSLYLEGCVEGIISPSGSDLYVASFEDDALAYFKRDESGNLSFEKAYLDDNPGDCNGGALKNPIGLVMSVDGTHLYSIAATSQAINHYNIDENGALTFLQTLNYGGIIEGLRAPIDIAFSADEAFLFVVSDQFDAISVLAVDENTGNVSWSENYFNNQTGIFGMDRPHSIIVSNDGQNLYVSCEVSNDVVAFDIDEATGGLSFLDVYQPQGFNGLHYATSMIMSPDDQNLYVAYPDGIYQYDRNTDDGTLLESNVSEVEGLGNVLIRNCLSVNQAGSLLYALSRFDEKLIVFERDPFNGLLTEFTTIENGVGGINGLGSTTSILLSEDDDNIYSFAKEGNNYLIGSFENNSNGVPQFVETLQSGADVVDGLDRSTHGTISPDGSFLYVSARADNAIGIFEIDPEAGVLSYIDKVQNGLNGTIGLMDVRSTAISPDGMHLYATGQGDKSLVVFDRDPATGMLSYKTKYTETVGGQFYGLLGCVEVALSMDGQFVYVISFFRHALLVFQRNASTGELTMLEGYFDGENGLDGLNFATSFAISPDQNQIYVCGSGDDAIAVFDRNEFTGLLTPSQVLYNGSSGVVGMDEPNDLVFSQDGQQLYITAQESDALVILNRNESDGTLTASETIFDGANGVVGLEGPCSIEIAPNGQDVYVGAEGAEGMVVFAREEENGSLNFIGFEKDGESGNQGLRNVKDILISEDSKFIYTFDQDDDGVGVFYNCGLEDLLIDISDAGELTCLNNELILIATATSGANISYEWTSNDGNIAEGGQTLNPIVDAPGWYTLSVMSNPFGCVKSDSVLVSQAPSEIIVDITTSPDINNEGTGMIEVIPTGGVAPYTYNWDFDPEYSDSILVDAFAGDYGLTILDVNGCVLDTTITVDLMVGISNQNELISVNIYPNPASDYLFIELGDFNYLKLSMTIYNILGQEVLRRNINSQEERIEIGMKDWENGVYTLIIEENEVKKRREILNFIKN